MSVVICEHDGHSAESVSLWLFPFCAEILGQTFTINRRDDCQLVVELKGQDCWSGYHGGIGSGHHS